MTKTCAVLSNNIVTNVILCDDIKEASEALGTILIEYTDENPAVIGGTYDEKTNKFFAPKPAVVEEPTAKE